MEILAQSELKLDSMGVYTRFKRNPDGFRALVELLESTPKSRRDKMIAVGMEEDAEYTEKAMKYMLTFQDVLDLSDMELAELVTKAPARMTAMAIKELGEEVQQRFLGNAQGGKLGEIREFMEMTKPSKTEIGGAQLHLVKVTRELEKIGVVRKKQIPHMGV